mmetsp:Transcript_86472/g.242026  ORF Transcript_86472/g.242026 Transcript_86472/m.242026 type:complete len:655 (+) Transcript_86472:138-2102(+)
MSSKKQVAGYILDKRIGKGSYATVWKGHVDGGDEVVAVKVVSRQTVTETAQLRQEVDVLRRISHANIVRFCDLKKSASHYYLVLEYCAGGDLSQFLRERGRVQESHARKFLTQITAGLGVLHRENVIHRDLKPQNILLSNSSNDPVLKIADFGFARALQPQDMAATVCGSPLYMAPEILRHEPYDTKADLWSVGAIFFELLLGRPPFSGTNPMQLLANIEKCDRLSFEGAQATVSIEGQDLLRALLVRLPAQRLSSTAFAQHAYVRLPDAPRDVAPRSGGATVGAQREGDSGPPPVSTTAVAASSLSGATSPTGQSSPALCHSPDMSPRHASASDISSGNATPFELAFEVVGLRFQPPSPGSASPKPAVASTGAAAADSSTSAATGKVPAEVAPAPAAAASSPGPAAGGGDGGGLQPPGDAGFVAAEVGASADANSGSGAVCSPRRRGGAGGGVEDDYVVVTEGRPPISGSTAVERVRGNGYCDNLSCTAKALEQLASRRREHFPLDALALLLRGLGLLEKALNVSTAEEEINGPLRNAFHRMLEAAEAAAEHIRTTSRVASGVESPYPPARPNQAIFEHAVQQTKDAAVALSKGREDGGWEAFCREQLGMALLLLDLLGSDADGEDLSVLASFTHPISGLLGEIDRLGRGGGQ